MTTLEYIKGIIGLSCIAALYVIILRGIFKK